MRKLPKTITLLGAAFAAPLSYSVDRSGDIVGEVWTSDLSPIIVTGDLQVSSLEIASGVEVLFAGEYELLVSGTIVAIGTAEAPIRFGPSVEGNPWRGIRFQDSLPGSELEFCVVEGSSDVGIDIDQSLPSLTDCVVRGNESEDSGGGIRAALETGHLRLERCLAQGNFAETEGGGLWLSATGDAHIEVVDCQILDNAAGTSASRHNSFGGGLFIRGSGSFRGTTVSGNIARAHTIFAAQGRGTYGGGAYIDSGDVEFERCAILGNRCETSADGQTPDRSFAVGGGLQLNSGNALLRNCLIANNAVVASRTRTLLGSAMAIRGEGSALLENCTLVANEGAAALAVESGACEMANSIAYFNNNGEAQLQGEVSASYSDVEGGWDGEGNIAANPILSAGGFDTLKDSPAVDAGNPDQAFDDANFPPSYGEARSDMGIGGGPLGWSFSVADECPELVGSEVCGNVVGEVWRLDMSPIIVKGDLQVSDLEIEAGVEVLFAGDYEMAVPGRIVALGTEEAPVRFAPMVEEETWRGLRFQDSLPGSALEHCIIEGSGDVGIEIDESLPLLRGCLVRNNATTSDGGGVRASISAGELVFENCRFEGNFAEVEGGGLWLLTRGEARVTLLDCEVSANVAGTSGSRHDSFGGGLYIDGRASLLGARISDNAVRAYTIFVAQGRGAYGAGVFAKNGELVLERCAFLDNRCETSAHGQTPDRSYAVGGGLALDGGEFAATNCLFADNAVEASRTRTLSGSAVALLGGASGLMENCTVAGNQGAAALELLSGALEIVNSIAYHNNGGGEQMSGPIIASYSDVEGGWEGAGMIDQDPFWEARGYSILFGSPAIDSGNPSALYNDAMTSSSWESSRADMGYGGGPLGWALYPEALADSSQQESLNASLAYLRNVMDQYHAAFGVYEDVSSPANHFPAFGKLPNEDASVEMNGSWAEFPYSGATSIRFEFLDTPEADEIGGVIFLNGLLPSGELAPVPYFGELVVEIPGRDPIVIDSPTGLNLSQAVRLRFFARAELADGESSRPMTFFMGGVGWNESEPEAEFPDSLPAQKIAVELTESWQEFSIDLSQLTPAQLSNVMGGFGWATNDSENAGGIVFYLDDISYELTDEGKEARLNEPRFLRSFTTKAVQPNVMDENIDDDLDFVLRNLAFTYDNALVGLAFLAEGSQDSVRRACLIGDAFVYASSHDRAFTDGRLRTAYGAGDIALPPGWTPNDRPGTVPVSGFFDEEAQRFFEVEQGAVDVGNNAWAAIFLIALHKQTNEGEYLRAALDIAEFIRGNFKRESGMYQGFTGGIADPEGESSLRPYASVEHNLDLFAVFGELYRTTGDDSWKAEARHARAFVHSMWDSDRDCFLAGSTGPDSRNENASELPLDTQSWSPLSMSEIYLVHPDVLRCAELHHQTQSDGYSGFDFNDDKDVVWFEGTAQMAVAYYAAGEDSKAEALLDALRKVQRSAPEGIGIYMASHDAATTGFGFKLYKRLHIAATAWNVFATLRHNPFYQICATPLPSLRIEQIESDEGFLLFIQGMEDCATYTLERSTNLSEWEELDRFTGVESEVFYPYESETEADVTFFRMVVP